MKSNQQNVSTLAVQRQRFIEGGFEVAVLRRQDYQINVWQTCFTHPSQTNPGVTSGAVVEVFSDAAAA